MKKITGTVFGVIAAGLLLYSPASAASKSSLNHGAVPAGKSAGVGTLASGVSGFAVVDADGALARKLNATGVIKLGTGVYEVDFNSKITKCAYTGTTGFSGSTDEPPPGVITVVGRNGNTKGLYIQTFDMTGTLADYGFHLLVTC